MTSAVRGSASTAAELQNLPTVVVNRAELAYRDEGEGEPVVFVPGTSSDVRTWEQQVPAIAESHRAIAYSRRYARPNEDIAPGTDDQMLPNVERVEIAAASHVMHEENASAVNEAILGFLAGRAAPGR